MFFLFHPKTRPTGRAIARMLGLEGHYGSEIRGDPGFLIRWGNPRGRDAARTINSARAVNHASNKLLALRAMSQAGVRVPSYQTTRPDVGEGDGIWFGRKTRGFGGRDILIGLPGRDLPEGWATREFYSLYVPNDREYRLHVVGGEVVRVQRKYLERPEQQANSYIRNHAQGYVFKAPAKRLRPDREAAAIAAVEALGLDFGAVDMVIGSEDDMPYVLEVNTAPACSPRTMQAYATALARMVQDRSAGEYVIHPQFDVEGVIHDG